jgi:hypothetical protein
MNKMFRCAIFDQTNEPRELFRVVITYKTSKRLESLPLGQTNGIEIYAESY